MGLFGTPGSRHKVHTAFVIAYFFTWYQSMVITYIKGRWDEK
jgi:hypothetical protein